MDTDRSHKNAGSTTHDPTTTPHLGRENQGTLHQEANDYGLHPRVIAIDPQLVNNNQPTKRHGNTVFHIGALYS